jgi:hypothetical protein
MRVCTVDHLAGPVAHFSKITFAMGTRLNVRRPSPAVPNVEAGVVETSVRTVNPRQKQPNDNHDSFGPRRAPLVSFWVRLRHGQSGYVWESGTHNVKSGVEVDDRSPRRLSVPSQDISGAAVIFCPCQMICFPVAQSGSESD